MADYAFRTIEDRRKIQEMWEEGRSPREIAGAFEKSLDVVYTELSRGRDGTRLPDQRLGFSRRPDAGGFGHFCKSADIQAILRIGCDFGASLSIKQDPNGALGCFDGLLDECDRTYRK